MSIQLLLLFTCGLAALWVWVEKPIARAAERQLRAEISDLRDQIRQCDEALDCFDGPDAEKRALQAKRDQSERSLRFLRTKIKIIA